MQGPKVEPRVIDVAVVDDHRAFADAISLAIDLQPDLRCTETVGTAEAAIEVALQRCPDVILLDLALPGMGGIEAITELRAACPSLRIIVLTANTSAETMLAAVEAGADAFLPKEQRFAEVLDTIRHGDDSLPMAAATMARLLQQARSTQRSAEDLGSPDATGLTDREFDVLTLLADGLAVKQVARRLGISVNTCRGHVRSLLAKFDAHSQLAAVVKAARAGMLPNLRGPDG